MDQFVDEIDELEHSNLMLWRLVFFAAVVGLMVLCSLVGVSVPQSVFLAIGALYLTLSSGRPRRLYLAVRTLGWFGLISSPRAMQFVLAAIGAAFLWAGIFVEFEWKR